MTNYQISYSSVLVWIQGDFRVLVDALDRPLVLQLVDGERELLVEHRLRNSGLNENEEIAQSPVAVPAQSGSRSISIRLCFEELKKK